MHQKNKFYTRNKRFRSKGLSSSKNLNCIAVILTKTRKETQKKFVPFFILTKNCKLHFVRIVKNFIKFFHKMKKINTKSRQKKTFFLKANDQNATLIDV